MIFVLQNNPRGRKALTARKWFAENGPPDALPLPLGYNEREALKHGGVDHILAWFARSLDCRNYDLQHPSFDDYARGVMASEFAPDFIKDDEALKKRFPPKALAGMGPCLYWLPPKEYAEAMERVRISRLPPMDWAEAIAAIRRSRGLDPWG